MLIEKWQKLWKPPDIITVEETKYIWRFLLEKFLFRANVLVKWKECFLKLTCHGLLHVKANPVFVIRHGAFFYKDGPSCFREQAC